MRYADHAYAHACDRPNDPGRGAALDRKAEAAGHESTADYVDEIQGHPDTRSFESSDGRTCWANEEAGLYGWNNSNEPEKSTVVPSRDAIGDFEAKKEDEASRQGVGVDQIEEKGPISEQDRQAPDRGQGGAGGPPPSDPEPEKGGGQGGAGGAAAASDNQEAPSERTPIPPPPPPPPPPEASESDDLSEERGR